MTICKIEPTSGMYVEDVLIDAIPTLENGMPNPSFISTPCPDGFYWPRWDGEKWIEGGTAPKLTVPEPTIEERLAAVEAAMLDLVLGGAS